MNIVHTPDKQNLQGAWVLMEGMVGIKYITDIRVVLGSDIYLGSFKISLGYSKTDLLLRCLYGL